MIVPQSQEPETKSPLGGLQQPTESSLQIAAAIMKRMGKFQGGKRTRP